MRKVALFLLIAIFLGLFVLYLYNKPHTQHTSERKAETDVIIEVRSSGIRGMDECLPLFNSWLKEHLTGKELPTRISVELRSKPYTRPVGTLDIFYSSLTYPPKGTMKATVWTACEKCEKDGDGLACYITITEKEKLTEEEKGALITLGLADGIFAYITKGRAEEVWKWEMFQPLIREEKGRFISNCLWP